MKEDCKKVIFQSLLRGNSVDILDSTSALLANGLDHGIAVKVGFSLSQVTTTPVFGVSYQVGCKPGRTTKEN